MQMMEAALFSGYPIMNEGMDMQPEHFLMGAHEAPNRQSMFNEYIKTSEVPVEAQMAQQMPGNHEQPMLVTG